MCARWHGLHCVCAVIVSGSCLPLITPLGGAFFGVWSRQQGCLCKHLLQARRFCCGSYRDCVGSTVKGIVCTIFWLCVSECTASCFVSAEAQGAT